MKHVFVETNWLVGFAAPGYRRIPAAETLLDRARKGDLRLHLPGICIAEATRTIQNKSHPRAPSTAIREFARWAVQQRLLTEADRGIVTKAIDGLEKAVDQHIKRLGEIFAALRAETCIEVFALSDRSLELSIDISSRPDLAPWDDPFDQSVLAAVLGRAEELRKADVDAELAFCELDGHLQHWDKNGDPRPALAAEYNARGIRVYGNFDLEGPARPNPV